MKSSDLIDVASRVREGVCAMGCTLRGVHFATCPDYGKDPAEASCPGCAPSPTHSGSVICSKCFGRSRALLRDAPDLVGRMRSLSDPTKAMLVEPVKISSRPVEAVAPVGPDLIDAVGTILANLRDWAHTLEPGPFLPWHSRLSGMSTSSAFKIASAYSTAIRFRLEAVTADPGSIVQFAEAVLVSHPEVAGERAAWSIQDAMDRWGAERKDHHVHPDVDDEADREEFVTPVREWFDPLLSVKDAAARYGLSEQTIRKWHLDPSARVRQPDGSVMFFFHASKLDEKAREMSERRNSGGRGQARLAK